MVIFKRNSPKSYIDYQGVVRQAPPNIMVVQDPRGGYTTYDCRSFWQKVMGWIWLS